MVGAAGLEPATPGLEGRCSIRMSYAPESNVARGLHSPKIISGRSLCCNTIQMENVYSKAPEEVETPTGWERAPGDINQWFRKPMLGESFVTEMGFRAVFTGGVPKTDPRRIIIVEKRTQ